MTERRSDGEVTHPIEGQLLLATGAKASVTLERLSALLERVQRHLAEKRESYDRRYERIHAAEGAEYFLVDTGHWATVGEELGLSDREADAVRRAHEQQFRRLGRRLDREAEFDASLDIREVAIIA